MALLNGHDYNDAVMVGTDGKAYDDPPPWAAADDPRPAFPDWFLADLQAVVTGAGGSAISVTSNSIGTGAKSFTLAQAGTFAAGAYKVYSAGSPANFMLVTLAADTSSSTGFAVTSVVAVGSGTFTDWGIVPLAAGGRPTVLSKSADYTVSVATDFGAVIEMTGSHAVNLPASASAGTGFLLRIINLSGTTTIAPNGADTTSVATLTAGQAVQLMLDGTVWRTLATAGAAATISDGTVSSLLFM